jgi:hypothetical protein
MVEVLDLGVRQLYFIKIKMNKIMTFYCIFSGRLSSQDDLDDDVSSLYTPSISGAAGKQELDNNDHSN